MLRTSAPIPSDQKAPPIKAMQRSVFILLAVMAQNAASVNGGIFVPITGGKFQSILKYEDSPGQRHVQAFQMMQTPVTNAEFLGFVTTHPTWRRDQIAPVFAEPGQYLSHWQSAKELGATAKPEQPVVNVSWFAASAYCESIQARLPTWQEWEFAAAADETRRDARKDPLWRERILGWYAKPATTPLPEVGRSPANYYEVKDLHGLIWEWTEDYAAMLVSGDNRTQSDPDKAKFCGAGALSMQDRENYAVMMRVAMLSSLEAQNSTSNLGFRCARDAQ